MPPMISYVCNFLGHDHATPSIVELGERGGGRGVIVQLHILIGRGGGEGG